MSISNKYRWALVGRFKPDGLKNVPLEAPTFNLADFIAAAKRRKADNDIVREYGPDNTCRMFFSKITEDDDAYCLILNYCDKNITGFSVYDFITNATTDFAVEPNQGGHYGAHIVIEKTPDSEGNHNIVIEKVPGIYLAEVRKHINWMCKDDRFTKEYIGKDGKPRINRLMARIEGLQSRTIREAINAGRLEDLEFVKYVKSSSGLDEDQVIDEISYYATWSVKKVPTDEQATELFGRVKDFYQKWRKGAKESQIYVRVRTGSGQVKTTEVDADAQSILEQAFIQNEKLQHFSSPLPPRYVEPHSEMVGKMKVLIKNLTEKPEEESTDDVIYGSNILEDQEF